MGLHKKHNAEDVRLKIRPTGRCPGILKQLTMQVTINDFHL
jgi:hypothetical protein